MNKILNNVFSAADKEESENQVGFILVILMKVCV